VSTVYLVPAERFIKALAEELKKDYSNSVRPQPWAAFVKTGVQKSNSPSQSDWWFTRSASVLRKLYVHGSIGVSRLRSEYGGSQHATAFPDHAKKGGGSIVRKILQQLEGAGLVGKNESKGRVLTAKGSSLLDKVAHKVRLSLQKDEIPELRKY
jgi:small subunit ribosomal protein S19e